jgi:hypothetical protein
VGATGDAAVGVEANGDAAVTEVGVGATGDAAAALRYKPHRHNKENFFVKYGFISATN